MCRIALFHYGYSELSPLEIWTIAVPRTISRAKLKIDALNFKAILHSKEHYELGKTLQRSMGVTLAVYDRERTFVTALNIGRGLTMKLSTKQFTPMSPTIKRT
jgi:hypothetical protein